jgi:hypothetical protein
MLKRTLRAIQLTGLLTIAFVGIQPQTINATCSIGRECSEIGSWECSMWGMQQCPNGGAAFYDEVEGESGCCICTVICT